jgi:hypothetical protein
MCVFYWEPGAARRIKGSVAPIKVQKIKRTAPMMQISAHRRRRRRHRLLCFRGCFRKVLALRLSPRTRISGRRTLHLISPGNVFRADFDYYFYEATPAEVLTGYANFGAKT